ncbi:MAG: imidazolonepropionase [Bacteroidota bacterium]|nr:imidazolonepropionase [Bacteroidota bacterium]
MKRFDLLIHGAEQVVTVAADGARAKAGAAMRDLRIIPHGAVGVSRGLIAYVGPAEGVDIGDAERVVDASGRTVLPGFVDCHTHLVFAGGREKEFARRIAGATYEEIAASGGGIAETVRATRAAPRPDLVEGALERLDSCLGFGTTTIEIKSGYGLDEENEIKLLEVVAELRELHVVDVVPTFLGAHVVPPEYRDRRGDYVALVTERMIPEVARRKLAESCDVFVERGAFTMEEGREILAAAVRHGLRTRVHADQFTAGGGAELAAEFSALSADHLDHAGPESLARLRESGTVAVLLPGVSLFLNQPMPDARRILDAGVPVALATDMNPGSCMSENIQLMGSLAAMQMRMSLEEVVVALTLNAAAALDRSDRVGSIEVGKKADLLVFDVPSYEHIFYHFGVNHLTMVVKNGFMVLEKGYKEA